MKKCQVEPNALKSRLNRIWFGFLRSATIPLNSRGAGGGAIFPNSNLGEIENIFASREAAAADRGAQLVILVGEEGRLGC
jgi:hypothetical protein